MSNPPNQHLYNPDWLSDEALVNGFVARMGEFTFLRDELMRAPLEGNVQHYLLVGLRGSGKTTLLKRLAVAIRSDADLKDHLIALSFPEELYQVKDLTDFWWASCDALADELDRLKKGKQADQLISRAEQIRANKPAKDAGLKLLQQTCTALHLRPVLLVDNLDLVFRRIEKTGRKPKDPNAAAYWELREALSTTYSPIVIGGSVRLSEPFTDYDKAFYDFFIPKHLGKLSLEEVQKVLNHLAEKQNAPEVQRRLQKRPARVASLYELTGGNLRAIGLIFELLRQGPSSRAVEDFERLMDITTPYYKARFEDLSEQAQVVMHALAVCRISSSVHFGYTAAELARHAGLPTSTVSAQLEILQRESLVEKTAAHGRTQYRIAEQLFRLWLQMRSTRRVRKNVIGLTEFLEAMFDLEEIQQQLGDANSANPLSDAKFSLAAAETNGATSLRKGFEAHGADRILMHVKEQGGTFNDYIHLGDLPENLTAFSHLRERLQQCDGGGLTAEEQEALLGSPQMNLEQIQHSVATLCQEQSATEERARIQPLLKAERQRLLRDGLTEEDLSLLFHKRAQGLLPLPNLTPQDVEPAELTVKNKAAFKAMVWHLVGAWEHINFVSDQVTQDWLEWGLEYARSASSTTWANVAGTMRRSKRHGQARQALDQAFGGEVSSRAWFEKGALLYEVDGDVTKVEAACRKAIELDPSDALPWNGLGYLFTEKFNCYDEAESAWRKAIELDPSDARPWNNLGKLLTDKLNRHEEAELAYRKAIELDPIDALPWNNLGNLLTDKLNRHEEAELAYRKAIELDPSDAFPWNNLAIFLTERLNRHEEAESAYHKAIELDPSGALPWNNLGNLLADKLNRDEEGESAYRKAIELDPGDERPWNGLGYLLTKKFNRHDEAELAWRKALSLDPSQAPTWFNLGLLLERQSQLDEAASAYDQWAELDDDPHPERQEHRANLQIRLCGDALRQALVTMDLAALQAALSQLLEVSKDIAASLVSRAFVEELLAPLLANKQGSEVVLQAMRDSGYEKYARPMLLAFEVALYDREAMLDELEPEIKTATRRIFERLVGRR